MYLSITLAAPKIVTAARKNAGTRTKRGKALVHPINAKNGAKIVAATRHFMVVKPDRRTSTRFVIYLRKLGWLICYSSCCISKYEAILEARFSPDSQGFGLSAMLRHTGRNQPQIADTPYFSPSSRLSTVRAAGLPGRAPMWRPQSLSRRRIQRWPGEWWLRSCHSW